MFLAHFKSQKIADLETDEELKLFVATLTLWKAMTGSKGEMTKEESILNQTFIKNSFGHLTIEQIGIAARMSFAGELGIDVNMYDKGFAPLYIGRVLSAYVKKNDDLLSKAMNQAKKLAANIPEQKRTLAQKREDVRGIIRTYLKKIVSDRKFEIDFKSNAFRVICVYKKNILSVDDLKKEYVELAEKDLKDFMDANALNHFLLNNIRADRDNRLNSYMEFRHNLDFALSLEDIDKWVDSIPEKVLWPDEPLEQPDEPLEQENQDNNQDNTNG